MKVIKRIAFLVCLVGLFNVNAGGEDLFSYPEGSTNTVLEHLFYSGTTNGTIVLPQSSDGYAVLGVTASGYGSGELIIDGKVVPLIGRPQMRGGSISMPISC